MAQRVKFQEIIDWIKEKVEEGKWKAGERIPTENELARQFGVSRQTVRHALDVLEAEKYVVRTQGSGTYVGPRAKVQREPREQHHNIAVISTYVDYYIFPHVLRGVESTLTSAGYTLQISFTNDSVHHERTILTNLIERNDVDGIIVEPAKSALPNPNMPLYRQLMDMNIPMIFFNASYPELSLPCVRIDDYETALKATELLIEAGHTRIAGIFNAEDGQGHLRYAGFLKALWDHHLRTDAKKTIWLDSDVIWNLQVIEDYLFDCLSDATGVVCYNDEVAYDVISLAQKRGIRIPEELSVVSIDDSNLASMCPVPITSFIYPKEELGRKLGENILKIIQDPSYDGNYLFQTKPALRASITRPASKLTLGEAMVQPLD